MDDISTLKSKTIVDLRIIAKELGIQNPTTLKKDTLLEKILEKKLNNKQSEEIIPEKKKRGRPAKGKETVEAKEIENIDALPVKS